MKRLNKFVARLQEKRQKFYHLCDKEVVGIAGVRTYAEDIISIFKDYLKDCEFPKLCIIAGGGLGRGEVSFDSDLDLVFLYTGKLPHDTKNFVESMISALWDMGFEVGQQVATPSKLVSLAKKDFTVCTSLLETKFLGGNKKIYSRFIKEFSKNLSVGRQKKNFFYSLKEFREQRMKQYGESIYLIEPNIKEGLGGIRDVHSIKWGSIVFLETNNINTILKLGWINRDEFQWLTDAYDFLWRTRIQLHKIGGNKKEQLSLEDQHIIAGRLGFSNGEFVSTEEAFMRMYYTHTSRIKRVANFFIEKIGDRFVIRQNFRKQKYIPGPFVVLGSYIRFKDPEDAKIRPEILMELFWNAARLNLKFHHNTGRIVRENLDLVDRISDNEKVVSMFFDILLNENSAFNILKVMHETKFLDTFIPEILPLRYRVQYDTYHTYTVDEHLLRCVKELHGLKKSKYVDLFDDDINLRVLFLAALLHDIGKGQGKNHAKKGGVIVKDIGKRLFLSEDDIELLSFLVENHLLLAETALKRDLEDEKPIELCASKIGSLERLKMLFLLQIADSKATGPAAWNGWRESLLEELFIKIRNYLTREEFVGGQITTRLKTIKTQIREIAQKHEINSLEKWIDELSLRYLLCEDVNDIYLHFKLEERLNKNKRLVVLNLKPLEMGMWEFVFVCKDHPRLFDFITGVLWVNGVNVLSADIFTRRYGVAVDIIKTENIPDPFNVERFCNRIQEDLERLILGKMELDEIYKNKYYSNFDKYYFLQKKDKVIIDEDASDFYTVIEVYTWERPGVLHTISKVLHKFGLNIKLAKITTPGAQVVDVFYVTTEEGSKILDPNVHEEIEKALLIALKELG